MREPTGFAMLDRRGALGLAMIGGLATAWAPTRLLAASAPELAGNLRVFAEKWVGPGKLPGMVIALGLPGHDTRYISMGSEGFLDADPMTPETLFRIYSMTKPVTGMATMLLVDEGKLALDQPITDFLPSFGKMQVQATPDGSITDLKPAVAPITVRHLITHTSGLPYGIVQSGPIRDELFKRGLIRDFPLRRAGAERGVTFDVMSVRRNGVKEGDCPRATSD